MEHSLMICYRPSTINFLRCCRKVMKSPVHREKGGTKLCNNIITTLLLALLVASMSSVDAIGTNAQVLRRRTQSSDALLQFQLIDASTGQVVVERLYSGMTVSLNELGLPESPSLNIVAVDETATIAAVKFSNGWVEGGKPFSYCGDVRGGTAYNSCDDLKIGMHEITASAIASGGILLGKSSLTFTIVNTDESEEELLAFRLVHVPTNTVVAELSAGMVVDLVNLGIDNPSFTIEAVGTDQVASVEFSNGHTEGAAPFYYCGDNGDSELIACTDLLQGLHTVSAKAISINGDILGSFFVTFEITSSSVDDDAPVATGNSGLQGSWIEVDKYAPLTARQEACFVFDDVSRRAYLIGGRDRGSSYPVDIYDPVTRQWSEGSEPPMELHHMDCIAVDGKIWIASAWTGSFPRESNVADIHIYDTLTDTWSTKDGLPENRRRGAAATILVGRRLYVSHGNRGGHETESFAESLGWLDYYDIDADEWTTNLPDAPNPRDHTGGALINESKICIAGGRNGGEIDFFNLVVMPTDCYDLSTGTWSVEADIPRGRAGSAYGLTCDGKKLIVAGGEGDGNAYKQVDVFDGTSWSTIDSLNQERHGTGLAVDCGCKQMHIASGAEEQGGGPLLNSLETFTLEGASLYCAS